MYALLGQNRVPYLCDRIQNEFESRRSCGFAHRATIGAFQIMNCQSMLQDLASTDQQLLLEFLMFLVQMCVVLKVFSALQYLSKEKAPEDILLGIEALTSTF